MKASRAVSEFPLPLVCAGLAVGGRPGRRGVRGTRARGLQTRQEHRVRPDPVTTGTVTSREERTGALIRGCSPTRVSRSAPRGSPIRRTSLCLRAAGSRPSNTGVHLGSTYILGSDRRACAKGPRMTGAQAAAQKNTSGKHCDRTHQITSRFPGTGHLAPPGTDISIHSSTGSASVTIS